MSDDERPISGLEEQARAIEAISMALVADVGPGWEALHYRVLAAGGTWEPRLRVVRGDEVQQVWSPRAALLVAKDLRTAMYRPGAGTWIAMELTVTPPGSAQASFDYESEPPFSVPISPLAFRQDQERFPRHASAQPPWLRERLAQAEKGENPC